MAAIRFFASGFRWRRNYPAPRLLAADHTSDPENLPFFCYDGCSGTNFGPVGFLANGHPRLPVASDLPTHSYQPPESFRPKLSACFSVAFATAVSLSGIRCRTN